MSRALVTVATFAALASFGCSTVRSSAVPTTPDHHGRYNGAITVSATRDPPNGVQVGTVEASSGTTIEEVVPEFIDRVAQLGGNFARIDQIGTRYQWVSQPVSQSYNCGSYRFPVYCYRTYMQNVEVATLRAVGRAFRVGLP